MLSYRTEAYNRDRYFRNLGKADNKQLVAVAMETIKQIVTEAQVIVNTFNDSGDSQLHLSLDSYKTMKKDIRKGSLENNEEENNKNKWIKNIATSTPQKISNVSNLKDQHQAEFIGQGDSTNIDLIVDDDSNFPSMLITIDNLIDISENSDNQNEESRIKIEKLQMEDEDINLPLMLITIDNLSDTSENCENNYTEKSITDNKIIQIENSDNTFPSMFVTIDKLIDSIEDSSVNHVNESSNIIPNIMDLPVDEVLNVAFKDDIETVLHPVIENGSHTTYTIITDALVNAIDDEITTDNTQQSNKEHMKDKHPHSDYFENPFLTFNREEDQCSGKTDIETPSQKSERSFHDIQLLSSKEHLDNNIGTKEKLKVKKLSIRSCRSGWVHRCRQRYVRILACVRRWWTRGPPNKQQINTKSMTNSTFPLSPTAKCRANSLDHRRSTPKFTKKYFVRKFDSLNNVFTNSSRQYRLNHNNDIVNF